MTIKEAAERYGVSKQAIYQRLKKAGQDLDNIRDPKTGLLSSDGEKLINSIYGQNAVKEPLKSSPVNLQVESFKQEREALLGQIEALKAVNEQLTSERDYLRRSLDQAQQLQAMAFARLPAPKESSGGWFKKIFTKTKES